MWHSILLAESRVLDQAYDKLCDAERSGSIRYAELIKLHHCFRLAFREGLEAMQREFTADGHQGRHRPRIPTSINLWMTGPIERALDRMDERDPRYPIFASFVSEVLATKARVARLTVLPPEKRSLRAKTSVSRSDGPEV